jgi:hypothetical protein
MLRNIDSKKDFKMIVSNYALGKTPDELYNMYVDITKPEFTFFLIDLISTDPKLKFRPAYVQRDSKVTTIETKRTDIVLQPSPDETVPINEYQDIINEHLELHKKAHPQAFKRKAVIQSLYVYGSKKGMKGDGLFSWIKRGYAAVNNFLSGPRKGFSARVNKFVAANGNKQILKMEVVRKPIFKIIEKAADIISAGKWSENKNKLSYDKMYHLMLKFNLEGRDYKIEKNETIEITPFNENINNIEIGPPIATPAGLTLNQFIHNARNIVSPDEFFLYSAFQYKCQHFITTLLKGSNLFTPFLDQFINQDARAIIEGLPHFETIANVATNLAGRLQHGYDGLTGGKLKKKRQLRKIV